jgi:ketosteroid isomerase-like protein
VRNVEIAEALFAAFACGDVDAARALCAPDMQAIQNFGPPMTIDALLEFSSAVHGVVQNFRYDDVIRSNTDAGFVEEHSVRGQLPDGSELKLAACVVADIRDGKIIVLREYVDGSSAAGLLKALQETRTPRKVL